MVQWVKNRFDGIDFGRGKRAGSMIPWIKKSGNSYFPFALWSDGNIELYFQHIANKKPFDSDELRLKFLEKFNEIDGISLQKSDINKRPSVKFGVLASGDNLKQFVKIIEWYLEKAEEVVN